MDAMDKAAPETRYCGRSHTLLYKHDYAPCLNRHKPPSPAVFPARISHVAGCVTPTGSAGHAGATANLELTFHPNRSAGGSRPLSGGSRPLSGGLLSNPRSGASCGADPPSRLLKNAEFGRG